MLNIPQLLVARVDCPNICKVSDNELRVSLTERPQGQVPNIKADSPLPAQKRKLNERPLLTNALTIQSTAFLSGADMDIVMESGVTSGGTQKSF